MEVAYHYWRADDGIADSQVDALQELGHSVQHFVSGAPLPGSADLVMTNGPFGSLLPLGRQLLAVPAAVRPPLLIWLSEQFWDPRLPTWLARGFSSLAVSGSSFDEHTTHPQLLRNRGARFRYFGELALLRDAGLTMRVFVHSPYIMNQLSNAGLEVEVAYSGYSRHWGEWRHNERDIPVLWLGKMGSRRRSRVLRRVSADLAALGIPIMIVDGVSHPYVFGEERTRLLNRTKIVLNLLRKPWDSNYLRWLLAISNGALVVSEPVYPHHPFETGRHLVVAPIQQLATTIRLLLDDAAHRTQISGEAYDYVRTSLRLEDIMSGILKRIEGK